MEHILSPYPLLSLLLFAGCTANSPEETGPLDDTTVTDTDPWPEDGTDWSTQMSIISGGAVLAPGDTLKKTTAPAGLDEPVYFDLTITNRSPETMDLSSEPGDWLQAEGFRWTSPPPASLESDSSAQLTLSFSPVIAQTAQVYGASLHVPNTDLTFTLQAHVPRPLRMVLVGNHGYTLISDNYGESFDLENIPTDTSGEEITLGVTYGNGTFVRHGREGGWGSDAVYAYSNDGEHWLAATVASGGWAFDCAFAFDAFRCARDAGYLTRSENGALFIHETAENPGTFIQGLAVTDTHLIGVGRNGTLAISNDGIGFQTYISDPSNGAYEDVASHDDVIVAVGGTYSYGYTISTSTNNGVDWTHQRWSGEASWTRLGEVVHNHEVWLTTGTSSTLPRMMRSYDGLEWESLATYGVTTSYTLLGALNGWIFATSGDGLHRTQDGIMWSRVHTFTSADRPTGFAAETWEGP